MGVPIAQSEVDYELAQEFGHFVLECIRIAQQQAGDSLIGRVIAFGRQ